MNRRDVRRASAFLTVFALGAAVTALPATATSPPATAALAPKAATATSWFHDPVSKSARKAEIAVPKHPTRYRGKFHHTKATYRTHSGAITVPASWAKGHELVKGQAVVLNKSGLFKFDKATPTKSAKSQLSKLNSSLTNVTSVRCEGYTDYAGTTAHEKSLSKKRAAAICKLVHSHRSSVRTTTVGYGGARPVSVGGTVSKRADNRRVIVVVTKTKAPAKPKPVLTVPSAPTLRTATAANASALLSFAAPSKDGGSPVTSYQVTTNGTTWHPLTKSGSNPYTATVTGLTNGTRYTVRVRAVNAVGDGARSNGINVTPVAGPGAPVLTTATPGNTTAAIAFAAPSDDGGAAITGYEASSNGGSTWAALTTTGTGPFTATITGLTNGLTYPVTVRAVNVNGGGVASNSIDVTPRTVPGAPTLSSVTPDSTTAAITFSAPSSTGGSAITSYQYSSNGTTWNTFAPAGTGPFTYTITGLTNGTSYPITVRAVNAAGNGPASNSINVTPASVSTAPVLNSATTPGDTTAAISFAAPSNTGGSAISGYQYSTNGTTWNTFTPAGTGPFTYTITGLTNGTTYPVTVRAVNAAGDSVASNSIDVTPRTVPSAPTLTTVTPGDGTAAISFSAPSSTGGSAITGYQYSTNGTTWNTFTPSGTGPFTATITGLTNGTTYPITVRAVNAAGNGPASNSIDVTPVGAAGPPDLTSATANYTAPNGEAYMDLEFAPPANDGGLAITGYEFSQDGGQTWNTLTYTPGDPYTARITEDWDCDAFTVPIEIRAVNSSGGGQASNEREVTYELC